MDLLPSFMACPPQKTKKKATTNKIGEAHFAVQFFPVVVGFKIEGSESESFFFVNLKRCDLPFVHGELIF